METPTIEQMYSDKWRDAVRSCYDALERPDWKDAKSFNSWDDVQKQILNDQDDRVHQANHHDFVALTPSLIQLRIFIDFFSQHVLPKHDTAVFWGMITEKESSKSRIPQMLRDICHRIEILNSLCSNTNTLILQVKEASLEIGLELLSFLSEIIKFLRDEIVYPTPGQSLDNAWQPLSQKLSSILLVFDDLLSRIEKLSKFARRSSSMDNSVSNTSMPVLARAVSQLEEQAKLPCVILPKIRTSRFFNRKEAIEKIEHHFNQVDPNTSFRSLALYGLGGVGKSSVALRFAELKVRRGELDAMFWVYSEKLVTIRQSFTKIAMQLKLPDARQGDHDENHLLVLRWLQHTQCRWLIVFDNVESIDLLRGYWPPASCGQALITTRSHSFAFELADGGLEITTWDNEKGSRFLLHLLSTDISAELKDIEISSVDELSQKLSGHALAICHMAGLIHRRRWSIAEFMEIYNQHPSEMHGVSGNSSINALWDLAFKSLDPQSRTILGILSFVSPDSIPQSLFELVNTTDPPESLHFCSDHLRFSEAIENLLTLALIKRDKSTRTLSIHRLVQKSFKYFMTLEQRQQSFNEASILLYLMWERCELWMQQVLSLKDCFREERKSNPNFTALQTYCDLNNACQRYLLEINSYIELDDLIQINRIALSSLPKEEQTIGLQGSLTSHTGQLLVRLGKTAEGVKWLRKSYEIRAHDFPFNPRESAWAAENAANGIASLSEYDEAIRWQELAQDHWLEWSDKQSDFRGVYPACLKKSIAMILAWAGQSERARAICDQAIQQIDSTEPYNWAMAAYTYFALGTIDRFDQKLELAEAHFMQAQNLWLKGDQLRTDPFNAACVYKMGCATLDQGKLEAAIKHLRDAVALTSTHKTNLLAEHARCVFKLSEALEQEPRDEKEASRLREEAERLLRQRDPGAKNPGVESTYDALIDIKWR